MKTLFAAFIFLLYAPFALAVDTNWGDARFVEGGERDGKYLAGLEFTLNEGWHTYWREPGPFGIPAQFDTLLSENIAGLDVIWPEPRLVGTEGAYSIGYETRVILPILITPNDPNAPVILRMAVNFGVCEEICIPARLEIAETTLSAEDKLGRRILDPWLSKPIPLSNEKPTCRFSPNDTGGTMDLIWQNLSEPSYPIVTSKDPAWQVRDTRDFLRQNNSLQVTTHLKQVSETSLARNSLETYIFTPNGGTKFIGCDANS